MDTGIRRPSLKWPYLELPDSVFDGRPVKTTVGTRSFKRKTAKGGLVQFLCLKMPFSMSCEPFSMETPVFPRALQKMFVITLIIVTSMEKQID